MAWLRNPGTGATPEACLILDEFGEVVGAHPVHVRLFNGCDTKARGDPPWPSVGPTQWRIRSGIPHPFDIREFQLA